MNRRSLILAIAVGTTGLTGCLDKSTTGHLTGLEVDKAPPTAEVVPVSDTRIADLKAVQSVVRQATAQNGETVTVEINGQGVTQTLDRLEKIPLYENESLPYQLGYYIEYDGQVVVVTWLYNSTSRTHTSNIHVY